MIRIHYKNGTYIDINLINQIASDYFLSTFDCDRKEIVRVEYVNG